MNRTELLKTAKPIIFNTEMVRAILDNRKTVTRRVIKPQPQCYGCDMAHEHSPKLTDVFLNSGKGYLQCKCGNYPQYSAEGKNTIHFWKPKYKVGDYLYVREPWGNWGYDNSKFNAVYYQYKSDYANDATGYWYEPEHSNWCNLPKWRSPACMPKEAARIFLRVTDVRVERLWDMDYEDCAKMGYEELSEEEFAYIWNSHINKKDLDKYGWNAHTRVWVYEFKRVEVK